MQIRELTESDRGRWNEFVGANPHGDVLQAWEWGEVKGAAGDWRPFCIAACEDDRILCGALVLRRSLPPMYYAPRGPLMADWARTDILRDLIGEIGKRARADKAILLKIDPAVESGQTQIAEALATLGFEDPSGYDPQGFGGTQPRCVMLLDIADQTEDEILMACKPQCRRNIRIAQKKGVQVVEATGRDHLAEFYRLLKVTAERDGFTVRGYSYYETLWDALVPRNLGKVFLTTYEGQYLSGAFCFNIGDKCWYVYGASSNEHRNVMPNYAMQWEMIRWAKSIGCRVYDFRGVSPRRRTEGEDVEAVENEDHLQGLNRFKEGFGARYVEYMSEKDLIYNRPAYWAWNQARPAIQKLVRRIRNRPAPADARRDHDAG